MSETRRWPESVRERTRQALDKRFIGMPMLSTVQMKHSDGRTGYMEVRDVMSGRLKIYNRGSGDKETYTTSQSLVESGWVLS